MLVSGDARRSHPRGLLIRQLRTICPWVRPGLIVPVACIGRLAVSTTFQKRPLGAALLWDGGLRAMQSSMGVFALVVMPTTRPPPRSTSITVSKDERMGVKPLDVGGVDDSPLNRPLRTHLEGYPMLASLNIFPYYFRTDRVGGGVTPAVLPHHRTCGSAYGGSLNTGGVGAYRAATPALNGQRTTSGTPGSCGWPHCSTRRRARWSPSATRVLPSILASSGFWPGLGALPLAPQDAAQLAPDPAVQVLHTSLVWVSLK